MKLYKKESLVFENGMFATKKGKIVMPVREVVYQFNKFECMFQRAEYDSEVADLMDEINGKKEELDKKEFVREHKAGQDAINLLGIREAKTPTLDLLVATSLNVVNELEDDRIQKNMAYLASHFSDLVRWVAADKVVMTECEATTMMLDLSRIEDPLKVDMDMLNRMFKFVAMHLDTDMED